MEFQDQLQSDRGRYFHNQPPAEFARSSVKMVGSPDDPSNNCSFATKARLRLESLKSGYNSASPRCVMGEHPCDGEDSQEEESILDSVELLDVEGDVQDEESW